MNDLLCHVSSFLCLQGACVEELAAVAATPKEKNEQAISIPLSAQRTISMITGCRPLARPPVWLKGPCTCKAQWQSVALCPLIASGYPGFVPSWQARWSGPGTGCAAFKATPRNTCCWQENTSTTQLCNLILPNPCILIDFTRLHKSFIGFDPFIGLYSLCYTKFL